MSILLYGRLREYKLNHCVHIVANLQRREATRRIWGQKFCNKNAIKTKIQNTPPKKWPHLYSRGAVPVLFEPSAVLFAKRKKKVGN